MPADFKTSYFSYKGGVKNVRPWFDIAIVISQIKGSV
jgi:hypothetical protein